MRGSDLRPNVATQQLGGIPAADQTDVVGLQDGTQLGRGSRELVAQFDAAKVGAAGLALEGLESE